MDPDYEEMVPVLFAKSAKPLMVSQRAGGAGAGAGAASSSSAAAAASSTPHDVSPKYSVANLHNNLNSSSKSNKGSVPSTIPSTITNNKPFSSRGNTATTSNTTTPTLGNDKKSPTSATVALGPPIVIDGKTDDDAGGDGNRSSGSGIGAVATGTGTSLPARGGDEFFAEAATRTSSGSIHSLSRNNSDSASATPPPLSGGISNNRQASNSSNSSLRSVTKFRVSGIMIHIPIYPYTTIVVAVDAHPSPTSNMSFSPSLHPPFVFFFPSSSDCQNSLGKGEDVSRCDCANRLRT